MPKDKKPLIDKTKKVSDLAGEIQGNQLFEDATTQLGIDPTISRVLLNGLLQRAEKNAADCTADDLRDLLPEIERRLQSVLKPNYVSAAVERLRRFLSRDLP